MSRIAEAFKDHKAFIPFVTCGDPDIETTKKIVKEMVKNGADLVELGIPFSDPTAEGPTIQNANLRALSGGVNKEKIFDMVRELREEIQIPFVFMTYANVVFSYGADRFFAKCKEVGMDGVILPDLPFEEKGEFEEISNSYGIDLISLIAPTSHDRIAMIAKESKGFIYIVSSLGVTGTRTKITTDVASIVKVVKENTDVPCAIGFGISNPEQAKNMASVSDGAIVGSAIVKIIAEHGKDCVPYVGEFVKGMTDAVHEV